MDEDRGRIGVRDRARVLEDGVRDVWDDDSGISGCVSEEDANSGPCVSQI